MERPEDGSARSGSLVFVIKFEGEFDLSDSERLRDAFAVPTTAQFVAVDLQGVSYVDSSVLKCLFSLRQRTAQRGIQLALLNPSCGVKRILEICRFDRLFDVRETLVDLTREPALDPAQIRTLTLMSRTAQA